MDPKMVNEVFEGLFLVAEIILRMNTLVQDLINAFDLPEEEKLAYAAKARAATEETVAEFEDLNLG